MTGESCGILIFDEYAETAQMVDTATGSGIHSSVAFCYQKIRKENGAVYTIVQTPDQLPDDENTKNIIGQHGHAVRIAYQGGHLPEHH